MCVHQRRLADLRSYCKECGGSQICVHGRHRHCGRDCGGSQICIRGKRRYTGRCKHPRTQIDTTSFVIACYSLPEVSVSTVSALLNVSLVWPAAALSAFFLGRFAALTSTASSGWSCRNLAYAAS